MPSAQTPLMQMLTGSMRYQTQRQSVLAHNIANIDTPKFKAQDLKKLDFESLVSGGGKGKLEMAITSPKHIQGVNAKMTADSENAETFEITPTKNNVSLEKEMAKISDTGAEFQVSSSLFRKYTGMYRAALGQR